MSNYRETAAYKCRQLDAAMASQTYADQLVEILGQAQRDVADDGGSNPYLDKAFADALQLADEMAADVDCWMAEVDPDTFERWVGRQDRLAAIGVGR